MLSVVRVGIGMRIRIRIPLALHYICCLDWILGWSVIGEKVGGRKGSGS